MKTSFRNTGFSDPLAGIDTTKIEVEQEPKRSYQRFNLDDLIDFRPANDPDCLIGNRWLGKGSTFVLSGEPGHGKSSLSIYFAAKWSLGLPAFGIEPDRALRCVIVQSENDEGDMAEPFNGQVDYKGLDESERKLLDENLIILQDYVSTGNDFAETLKHIIEDFKPDVVIADPLMTYAGCDLSRQSDVAAFLYNTLNPIIKESGILCGFVHHDKKPNADQNGKKKETRAMHNSFGSVVISAWAREVISLVCTDEKNKQFELQFGKRGNRTGVGSVVRIRHTKEEGIIRWEPMKPMEGTATGSSKTEKHAKMEVGMRAELEKIGYLGKSTAMNYAKSKNWSKVDAWNFVHSLVDGVNYHFIELFGHPTVSKTLNPIEVDPNADKKKVLAFIKRGKVVSKNKLEQWAEGDTSAPSGKQAIKLAELLLEEGEIKFTEKFQFPGNNAACKVYSIGEPTSYRWIDGKPVTEEEFRKRQQDPNTPESDPFQ